MGYSASLIKFKICFGLHAANILMQGHIVVRYNLADWNLTRARLRPSPKFDQRGDCQFVQ